MKRKILLSLLANLLPCFLLADGSVDITSMLVNPGFEDGINGWTNLGTNGSRNSGGLPDNKCFEVWDGTYFDFDIYQELHDMPEGVYELAVQGFYRYKNGNEAWNHYISQDVDYVRPGGSPVFFYINESSEPFLNIFEDFTKDGVTYYYPNDMRSAAAAFSAGLYNKSMKCKVNSGTLRIGIKGTGSEWACWDNVRLFYYGNDIDIQDNPIEIDGIFYKLPQNTTHAEVTSNPNRYSGSVNIPNTVTYNGVTYTVTSIGEKAFYNSGIESVTIPSSVTTIGSMAFFGCKDLKEVYSMIENPFAIDKDVFQYYNSSYNLMFTSATLYVLAGKKSAYKATAGWSSFTNIEESDFFTVNTKEGVTMTFKITDKTEKTCQVGNGKEASVNVGTPGQVTIPTTANGYKVTAIGDYGFYNCSKLTHIWIQEGVERIGKFAFWGCSSLRVLDLPSTVKEIDEDAFKGNPGMTVNLPINLLPIMPTPGEDDGITIVVTPPSNGGGSGSEAGAEMERIFIPRFVTEIGERAYSGCKSVKVIEVDAENKVFDSRNGCNAIIRTADNTLLFGCQNTLIPETVTAIDSYAFEGHSNLKTITIPQTVKSIGQAAFSGCTALITITSNISTPFAINDNTFTAETYQNATLIVPYGTKSAYKQTAGWKNFFNIVETEPTQTDAAPYAVYNNGTLTFYCDNQRSNRQGTTYDLNTGYDEPGWYVNAENITTVVFDASFANARPTSMYYWFSSIAVR